MKSDIVPSGQEISRSTVSGYEHLATKADLHQLENVIYRIENRMTQWLIGLVIAVAVMAVSVVGLYVQALLA